MSIDCSPKLPKEDNISLLGESHVVRYEKFSCECIMCGYTMESNIHCNALECPRCGGTMRRAERPGPGQPRVQYKEPSVVYQGVPAGLFVSPYIEVVDYPDNKVPVGEQIRLRAHYRVSCPGQPWYAPEWTIAVKAKGDGIACKNDHTLLTGAEVTGSDYLNSPAYPVMPDRQVTLEVTLWGNPAAFQKLPLEDP